MITQPLFNTELPQTHKYGAPCGCSFGVNNSVDPFVYTSVIRKCDRHEALNDQGVSDAVHEENKAYVDAVTAIDKLEDIKVQGIDSSVFGKVSVEGLNEDQLVIMERLFPEATHPRQTINDPAVTPIITYDKDKKMIVKIPESAHKQTIEQALVAKNNKITIAE